MRADTSVRVVRNFRRWATEKEQTIAAAQLNVVAALALHFVPFLVP